MSDLLETKFVTTIKMSPEEYLKAKESNPASVARAKIIAPSMDDDDFGGFLVQMKAPRYEVEL